MAAESWGAIVKTFVNRYGETVNKYENGKNEIDTSVPVQGPKDQYDATLAKPNVNPTVSGNRQFDYTAEGGQPADLRGTSLTSPYGPNTGDNSSPYVGYVNPHGGSTFIGILPNGKREIITQQQAINLGYEPSDRAEFGPDMTQPPVITPGGTPDDGLEPKDPFTPPTNPNPPNPNPNTGGDYTPSGGFNWSNPGAPSLEGGGGYDPADYAFDNFVPGKDSPWGIPDVEGGNKDFYRNQLLSSLNEEQTFRKQQREAAEIRQQAADNPIAPRDYQQMWQDMGFVPNQAQEAIDGSDATNTWQLNDAFTPGETTNAQFLRHFINDPSITNDTQKDWYREFLEPESLDTAGNPIYNDWQQKTGWSQAGSPDKAISWLSDDPNVLKAQNKGWLSDIIRLGYDKSQYKTPEGGGPTAAPGYALPI